MSFMLIDGDYNVLDISHYADILIEKAVRMVKEEVLDRRPVFAMRSDNKLFTIIGPMDGLNPMTFFTCYAICPWNMVSQPDTVVQSGGGLLTKLS